MPSGTTRGVPRRVAARAPRVVTSGMHALGRLITERKKLNGWSLPQVVKRAEARGARLGKSNLSKLENEMTPTISKATIDGLAAGLGVTPLTVANAALKSWGIEPHPVEVTDSIRTIEIDPSLSDRDRRQLVALVKEMRDDTQDGQGPVVDDVSPAELVGKIRELFGELRQLVPRVGAVVDESQDWSEGFVDRLRDELPPVGRSEDRDHPDELGGR